MKIAACNKLYKSTVTKVLVLVSAIPFAKVLLLVLTMVFTRTVNTPARSHQPYHDALPKDQTCLLHSANVGPTDEVMTRRMIIRDVRTGTDESGASRRIQNLQEYKNNAIRSSVDRRHHSAMT